MNSFLVVALNVVAGMSASVGLLMAFLMTVVVDSPNPDPSIRVWALSFFASSIVTFGAILLALYLLKRKKSFSLLFSLIALVVAVAPVFLFFNQGNTQFVCAGDIGASISSSGGALNLTCDGETLKTVLVNYVPSFDMVEGKPSVPESDYAFVMNDTSPRYARGEVTVTVRNIVNSGTGVDAGGIVVYSLKTKKFRVLATFNTPLP
ncbi:MAG: hypothetical protein KBC74_01560 [Candidatus Pacebacteria bacterium]|nr:hypothetical protein [Candidatus Paceibacterota bacterium]MBP9832202.1 hypothetical protein [Candidatus Paceibacterota bacterium]